MELNTPLTALPGVGPARARSLEKLGLRTVGDLLGYYPRDYEDRTKRYAIAQAPADTPVCVSAMVAETPRLSRIRKGLELTRVKVVDGSAAMTLTFFNQSYVRDALVPGQEYIFYGRVEGDRGGRQMTNPVFEREDRARFTGRILPVYPLTAGVSNNLLAGLAQRAVEECACQVAETLPADLLEAHDLAPAEFSCRSIHFPQDFDALARAKRRLVFEELFTLSAGLALLRQRRSGGEGPAFPACDPADFYALLPFAPTEAQRRTISECAADLASGRPMNRLLQGDVGSGKTAVAAACAWMAFRSGWQAAMMAPTEILAEQHCRSLSALLAPAGMRVGLLTGSMRAGEKKRVYAALEAGEIDFVVGTHALLSGPVAFRRLGLVVADEQHRFGVEQRARLWIKNEQPPHILVMTATPIPRTLAMTLYGDLDVSVIDELPPGRRPIKTVHYTDAARLRLFGFMKQEIAKGRQVYVVYPLIKESEAMDYKDLTDGYEAISRDFPLPDYVTTICHGKMKPADKEESMRQFKSGEADIMVATSVIEVGVDVPNATVMVIESAERFGLSQLHQLRGRVGRGGEQSYCILMSGEKLSKESRARLDAMCETNDGFRLAELDLKLRGAGDINGTLQSGMAFDLKIANPTLDVQILTVSREAAAGILSADRTLSRPEHRGLRELRRRYSGREEIDFSMIS